MHHGNVDRKQSLVLGIETVAQGMPLSSGVCARWEVRTASQGRGGEEGSNIWVRGAGGFQDTMSKSSLTPCKELLCYTEIANMQPWMKEVSPVCKAPGRTAALLGAVTGL